MRGAARLTADIPASPHPAKSLWMNFFKDKFSRPKKSSGGQESGDQGTKGDQGLRPYFTTVESAAHGGQHAGRPFPASLSTGSFTPFQSQTEIKTFPRSATTQTFQPSRRQQNGSVTSSSQSSDESEEGGKGPSRVPRRRPGGSRSSSLPRHSSASGYRRSVTMPDMASQDDREVGDNRPGRGEDNKARSVILPQIGAMSSPAGRAAPQGSPQLNSWLQSLAEVPEWGGGGSGRGSKSEILRISRGRLKDDPTSGHQLDNKRKRNSSRENSLESLLEEEDQTAEDSRDCTSRHFEDEAARGAAYRVQQNQKNSLESLLEDQGALSVAKHKTNSLPKSNFSNIQLRVQEIRDQLEVLKKSSSTSGSKALQQVFPRIRPHNLTAEFMEDCYEGKSNQPTADLHAYSTPVNPTNPIYNLNSSLSSSSRPGFLNNRPMSMPSPPLASSPGNSPNSLSPRSLSPNQNSPKHNIRPSSCYSSPANPNLASTSAKRREPNPFTDFGPSPVSSPSTLSPCSSNSLPSSQAGSLAFFMSQLSE